MKTGTLVARIEAPTVLYRVTSIPASGYARLLPYQRSGREIIIARAGSRWIGDGSVWKPV